MRDQTLTYLTIALAILLIVGALIFTIHNYHHPASSPLKPLGPQAPTSLYTQGKANLYRQDASNPYNYSAHRPGRVKHNFHGMDWELPYLRAIFLFVLFGFLGVLMWCFRERPRGQGLPKYESFD